MSILLFTFLFTTGSVIGFVPQQAIAALLDNAITIQAMDGEGNNVLPLTAVNVEPGDSAYDVLIEAAELQGIEVVSEDFGGELGKFVSKIGNLEEDNEHYWSFLTQGEYSQVGASSYKVNNGDNLAFTFVSLEDEGVSEISVKVSVKYVEGNPIIEETNVAIDSRSSAYDALYQAALNSMVELNVSVDDQYFTFINNIGNQDLGDTDYWNLAVNDEDSQTGAIATLLNDGDHVQLSIKSFENTDPEEPIEPSEPEKPTEPEQPVEPSDPEEPIEPSDPEEPTDPEKPTNPSEPEQPVEPSEPEGNPSQIDVATRIQGLLNYIDSKNVSFEYFSEWWIWSLSHIDFDVPASYIDSITSVVKENEGKLNGLELQKIIIALSLQGEDATDFAGYNLVDNMLEQKRRAINDYIYTLLAIDSNDYEVTEGTREGLIDAILAEEKADGGWSLFGDTPSIDITGMVLSSLAPYQDRADVKASIDHAVTIMSEMQQDNGGYFEKFNGGDTSESVSQAIIGLVSVGIDPTSKDFTKPGGNLLQHLFEFKQEDEGYSHRIEDTKSMAMSTQQALLAYVAYEKFVEGTGLIYQNSNPEKPTPDPEKPTPNPEKPAPNPEKPTPDPEKPAPNPEKPTLDPEKSTSETETTNNKSEANGNNQTGEKLPTTSLELGNYVILGLMAITLGLIIAYFNRKNRDKA